MFEIIYFLLTFKNIKFSFIVSDKRLKQVHRLVRRKLKVIKNMNK